MVSTVQPVDQRRELLSRPQQMHVRRIARRPDVATEQKATGRDDGADRPADRFAEECDRQPEVATIEVEQSDPSRPT
jgi:hypothetical protein